MKVNYKIITIFSLLLISMSMLSVGLASASTSKPAYLQVVTEKINPYPVEPGQDFTVTLRVSNAGSDLAHNASLTFTPEYPFILKSDEGNFNNMHDLCAGCSVENTYYLVADANAKSGLYPLTYQIKWDGGMLTQPANKINIKVVGVPDLVLETKPLTKQISSGDNFTVQFNLDNIGTGIARRIKIIPQSDNIVMLGSNVDVVNEIKPDSSSKFDLKFTVKETLPPDTYKFPIKIEYMDEQGKVYATSFDVGVNVLKRSDIDIQSLKITPSFPTLVDKVHMEGIIENTGTGDADRVIVQLIAPNNQTYKTFVGQLKANDDAPFYFDLKPQEVGVQNAILKVTYEDDFGTHSFETTITKDVKRPTNNLVTIGIILVLLLLVVGYFYFKKNKAKK